MPKLKPEQSTQLVLRKPHTEISTNQRHNHKHAHIHAHLSLMFLRRRPQIRDTRSLTCSTIARDPSSCNSLRKSEKCATSGKDGRSVSKPYRRSSAALIDQKHRFFVAAQVKTSLPPSRTASISAITFGSRKYAKRAVLLTPAL